MYFYCLIDLNYTTLQHLLFVPINCASENLIFNKNINAEHIFYCIILFIFCARFLLMLRFYLFICFNKWCNNVIFFFCPFVDDHYYFIQRLFASIFQLTRSRFFEFDWDHNSIIHNIKHEIFSDASLVIRKDRERERVCGFK